MFFLHVFGAHAVDFRFFLFQYVAATGLPTPQCNHAVNMVKFAGEAMLKFSQIRNDLAESLGADTANLEMRVGLHSGATTAGVLRGDKSRFQLFVSVCLLALYGLP